MAKQSLSINDLPSELLSEIFRFIQPLEMLLDASRTCRLWRQIINNEWFLNKYFTNGLSRNQLIGWWNFNDVNNIGHDSSGILGDRYHTVGRPTVEDCFLGKCAVFDGQSFIDFPVNHKSEYQTDLYSVSIWFCADPKAWNRNQQEGGWRTAIGCWNDWSEAAHAWLHLGFHVDTNIHNQVMISPAQYAFGCYDRQKTEPNRWYHVVVRVSRQFQELWVNGRVVSRVDMTNPELRLEVRLPYRQNWQPSQWCQQRMHLPEALYIGSKNNRHHNPWIGKIADISVWRRWLKPFEIRALYKQQAAINNVKLGSFVHGKHKQGILCRLFALFIFHSHSR
uniref:F-box domain proteins-like protein n=1 Tax=Adineta vaga TaxID=104782 RepID=B3G4J2_ADIVA|nr:F-box domain proteins-like protein [Adineta vaga]